VHNLLGLLLFLRVHLIVANSHGSESIPYRENLIVVMGGSRVIGSISIRTTRGHLRS
jgi:hypothetical protein